jgi:predicted nuclease of predicted toxin-antitoxin system
MKFLIDNAVSATLSTLLQQAGHDALYVRAVSLQGIARKRNAPIMANRTLGEPSRM